jgi:hypothetical protein
MTCKLFLWSVHTVIVKRDTHILPLISNTTLHWHYFDISSINILSLICFAWNGLLIVSHISGLAFDAILLEMDFSLHLTSLAWPLMLFCFEKSILTNQITNSIYACLWLNIIYWKTVLLGRKTHCSRLGVNYIQI